MLSICSECHHPTMQKEGLLSNFHFIQSLEKEPTSSFGCITSRRSWIEMPSMMSCHTATQLVNSDRWNVWTEALDDCPQTENCAALADYVTESWAEGSWPRSTWNHFETEEPRTNNNVDGWLHRMMNVIAIKAHPNVFEFIAMINKSNVNDIHNTPT